LRFQIHNQQLTATIDMMGAELKSLKDDNFEYVWTSDPKYWHRSAPFLFPAIGSFLNEQTMIDGRVYHIPKHGFIKDMKFSVSVHTEDTLTLYYDATDESLKLYPYAFLFQVTYQLLGSKLSTTIVVKNNSDDVMPFNIGGHPAFSCPIDPNDAFTDYELVFPKTESFVSPEVNLKNGTIDWTKENLSFDGFNHLPLRYEYFKKDALIFDRPKSTSCILQHQTKPLGIQFDFDGFYTLGIWTPFTIDAPFICLEPWIGCADHPNASGNFIDKKDILFLKPNETFTISYHITIRNE
jgi:galactose mutarotase-like enzyme